MGEESVLAEREAPRPRRSARNGSESYSAWMVYRAGAIESTGGRSQTAPPPEETIRWSEGGDTAWP
jgi:hypothetical protein